MSTSQATTATDEAALTAADLFTDYGVTHGGFRRPHIDVIWEVAVNEAENRLGRTLTAPTSAELQYIEMLVLWTDTYFETLEGLYYAAYYQHAQGRQLDNLLAHVGFKRLPRREATGEVTFESAGGQAGNQQKVVIPAGTRVATQADETTPERIFATTQPATLPAGQPDVTRIPIKALDPLRTNLSLTDEQTGSATNVPAGTITRIVDPISGVMGVTNPLPTGGSGTRADGSEYGFISGRDKETDPAFKHRYEQSLSLGGSANIDAIKAAIYNAGPGDIVYSVDVEEQLPIEGTTDASGVTTYTGRQIRPIVALTEDTAANRDAVSQAIFDTRAAGIRSVGNVTGTAERSDGTRYSSGLAFDLATEVPVYVTAELVVSDTFPETGEEQIVENLIHYIGGVDFEGTRFTGTDIGDDIYYSRIYGDVMDNDIPGIIQATSITLGKSPTTMGTTNLTIGPAEVARTSPAYISLALTTGSVT